MLLHEDRHFYRHFAVNPLAFLRAIYVTYVSRERRVGGSTIPMPRQPTPRRCTICRRVSRSSSMRRVSSRCLPSNSTRSPTAVRRACRSPSSATRHAATHDSGESARPVEYARALAIQNGDRFSSLQHDAGIVCQHLARRIRLGARRTDNDGACVRGTGGAQGECCNGTK